MDTQSAAVHKQKTITYRVELTDTFGGEPNYSWVRRRHITVAEDTPWSDVLRAAAEAMLIELSKSDIDGTGKSVRHVGDDENYGIYFDDDNTAMFLEQHSEDVEEWAE